jgi:23S rRNA pseudouridine1911/1915/1917 synthase
MDPKILFENSDYLVVNKPAGLMVHGDGRSSESTLADWLIEQKKVSPDIGEPWTNSQGKIIPRPGIVHRLDRDTSGVLVIAKTSEMYEWLKKQFQDRLVQKEYRALVAGTILEESGTIDRQIGKSASDFRKKSATRGAKGVMRDAVTDYKVIARKDGKTLVALFPKTGRTHQLRVHMKAINHPIMGDTLYGGIPALVDWGHGLALHAHALTFKLPTGETVAYKAPVPTVLER